MMMNILYCCDDYTIRRTVFAIGGVYVKYHFFALDYFFVDMLQKALE